MELRRDLAPGQHPLCSRSGRSALHNSPTIASAPAFKVTRNRQRVSRGRGGRGCCSFRSIDACLRVLHPVVDGRLS